MTPAETEYLIRMVEKMMVNQEEVKRLLSVIITHYDEWARVGMVVRVLSTMVESLDNEDMTFDVERGSIP